jgi:hypothetical protein
LCTCLCKMHLRWNGTFNSFEASSVLPLWHKIGYTKETYGEAESADQCLLYVRYGTDCTSSSTVIFSARIVVCCHLFPELWQQKGTLGTLFQLSNQYEKQLTVGENREYTLTRKRNHEGRINVDLTAERPTFDMKRLLRNRASFILEWQRIPTCGRGLMLYAMGSYC